MTDVADTWVRPRRGRAEQVADVLRARMASGHFRPGERLVEDDLTRVLDVSRNTLREAFRLLERERLVEHRLNRGVVVRRLSLADVVDLYTVRRHVEVAAVAAAGVDPPTDGSDRFAAIADAVTAGQAALSATDQRALATANIAFHQGLVALSGSDRLDELMRGVWAEMRLVFHVVDDPRVFHGPYLTRNGEILTLLRAGRGPEAAVVLAHYLDDAERQLVAAYAASR